MMQVLSATRQFLRRLLRWPKRPKGRPGRVSPERQRALALIAAIDAGGVPLNPARVNDIARQLGLEVSRHAAMEQTLARIRKALDEPASG